MKSYLLSTIILILAVAFSINAQNYGRLEQLTNDLEEQTDELVNRTSEDIRKGSEITGIKIERAFMAEQLSASIKLMKRLVDEKYGLAELRSGGGVLADMLGNMPTSGLHITEWNKVKGSINSLTRELQNNQTEVVETPRTGDPNNILGRVFWTGMVDATVHLVINGSDISTKTIIGTPYPPGIPSFTKSLPRSENITVGVTKKSGRGNAKVIQQPNSSNNYTAIVEIHDEGGGAKSYTVEVFWF